MADKIAPMLKIYLTPITAALIDTETGEEIATEKDRLVLKCFETLKKAKYPENVAAWNYDILKNSIFSELLLFCGDFDKITLNGFGGWKKRAENALKTELKEIEKLRQKLKMSLHDKENRNNQESIKTKINKIERLIRTYPKKIEYAQKNIKRVSNCPKFHKIKTRNFTRQMAVFELKKLII